MHNGLSNEMLFEMERRIPRRPAPQAPPRPTREPRRLPRFTRRVPPGRR